MKTRHSSKKSATTDVVLYGPKGKRERTVAMLVLGGKMNVGETITLSKNVFPLTKKKFVIVGFDNDGTPRVTDSDLAKEYAK